MALGTGTGTNTDFPGVYVASMLLNNVSDASANAVFESDIPVGGGSGGTFNGVGIAYIKQTVASNEDGGNNVFTITLTDGTVSTFIVKNGSKGSRGANGANGYSPTISVDDIIGGNRITFKDVNGEQSVDVTNDLIVKEGNSVTAALKAGRGITAMTAITPKQDGEYDPCSPECSRNLLNVSVVSNSNKATAETLDNGKTVKVTATDISSNGLGYVRYECLRNPAPGTVVTISVKSMSVSAKNKAQVRFIFAVDGSSVISNKLDVVGTNTITIPEYTGEGSLRVNLYVNNGDSAAVADGDYAIFEDVQVEYGNTATEWQPYENIRPITGWDALGLNHHGEDAENTLKTYAVQIGQTIYGGTMDWLTGKLVVDWYLQELTGASNESWKLSSTGQNDKGLYRYDGTISSSKRPAGNECICSHATYNGVNEVGIWLTNTQSTSNTVLAVRFKGTWPTLDDFKAWLTEAKPKVVYKVAKPVEIQLTGAGVLEAVEGVNTVTGDGNLEVTFNHDRLLTLMWPKLMVASATT